MEFADEFPSAIVKANDLSPIQPVWVPSNIQFEIADIEDPWSYSQPFDYIHIRNMTASISNWSKLCTQALQHLTPGGYIEVQEHGQIQSADGELPPNIKEWLETLEGAYRIFGKEMDVAKNVKDYLITAGFENVQEDKYKVSHLSHMTKKSLLYSIFRINIYRFRWDLGRKTRE